MSLELSTGCFWCRDISPLSRHQLMSLELSTGRFLVSRHHFMSLQLSTDGSLCRDINLLSRHQLKELHLLTEHVLCRDINLSVWRLQLVAFGVATPFPCRAIILDQRKTCHSFKALLLSRPPSLVATSTFVATSRCCRDIIH